MKGRGHLWTAPFLKDLYGAAVDRGGLQVCARNAKNVQDRKTEICNSGWLGQLHS